MDYFSNTNLMKAPTRRAAYSDRTSYLMAEMSRLAYFKFEGGSNIQEIMQQVSTFLPEHDGLPALEQLIQSHIVSTSSAEASAVLDEILQQSGFNLIKTFCDTGTDAQAFLCVNNETKMAVLAFRGTELSLKDIKTDISARLTEVVHDDEIVLMHSGYWIQFSSLRDQIEMAIQSADIKDKQLYITGHSLGGALAVTATKFLASDSTGACYTYGSPPVGTKDFETDIKTPIYRIVNHVDIVPRLPNPTMVYILRMLAMLLGLVLSLFPGLVERIQKFGWYDKFARLVVDAQRYRQSGYGSYLEGEGQQARLRYSITMYDKLKWWWEQIMNLFRSDFKLLTDHSIDVYSRKLAIWAENVKRQ